MIFIAVPNSAGFCRVTPNGIHFSSGLGSRTQFTEKRWEYDRTAAGPFVKLEQDRTDEYLLMPDCDTVSVKQRQGRLEVKALVAGPRPFSQGRVVGRVDQWVKWSFDPSEAIATQFKIELDQSGPWRRVLKKRYTPEDLAQLGPARLGTTGPVSRDRLQYRTHRDRRQGERRDLADFWL